VRSCNSVLMATSVIHKVAGGTQLRRNHPAQPIAAVTPSNIAQPLILRSGKLTARLGIDNAMATPKASL